MDAAPQDPHLPLTTPEGGGFPPGAARPGADLPPNIVQELERTLAGIELNRADMNEVFQAVRDMLQLVDDPRKLLDAILAQYSQRLDVFPGAPILPGTSREMNADEKRQLSLLVLYATQAVLLKEKADLFARLRQAREDLSAFSMRLQQALSAANDSRRLMAGTLESLPVGVVVLNRAGSARYVNSVAQALLDLDAAVAADPAVVARLFEQPPATAGEPAAEVEVPDEAGGTRTIQKRYLRLPDAGDAEPLGILLLVEVTEEHRLRDEIFRNGRLSAVLDTWAALNHEINNPLAAILGRAQMLLARGEGLDERTAAGLKVIEESARRIADLTAQLKEISEPAFTEYTRGVMMLDIRGSRKRAASG
jgi:signal transduction histidine kinase